MSRKGRRSGPKRSYTLYLVLALVVATGVVGYYIFTQSGVTGGTSSPLIGQTIPSTLANELSGVSQSTLSFIGPGTAGTVATSNSTAPLTSNGKPEVLYMGAEYCPYCAAERWAMIVALDRFGSFTGLEYMQSSATDIYPNTATFTFLHANYTSAYITFVPVEQYDRSDNPLMTASASQTSLMSSYDSAQSIPFVDIGNRYTLVGSQITPPILRAGQSATGNPYNWTEIGSQLNNETNPFAQNIDGAANRLIAAICKVTDGSPTSVCSNALTVSYIRSVPSGSSQLLVSDVVPIGPFSSSGAPPPPPSRFTGRL